MLWIIFQEVDENDSNAKEEASQPKKIGADPFNNDEADPAKSGAMRK
jgi:U3 small nucleolar RNA-associated protein 19